MGVVLQFSFSVQAVIIDGPSGEDYMFFRLPRLPDPRISQSSLAR